MQAVFLYSLFNLVDRKSFSPHHTLHHTTPHTVHTTQGPSFYLEDVEEFFVTEGHGYLAVVRDGAAGDGEIHLRDEL